MCTAVSVYAHMCNLKGVVVDWRSQELCPIQCQRDCDRYVPCLSTCPLTTCQNFNSTDVQEYGFYLFIFCVCLLLVKAYFIHHLCVFISCLNSCQSDICVEGCDPKPCADDMVYNNEKDLTCVPITDCLLNCTLDDGRQYRDGERIIDATIDSCITW